MDTVFAANDPFQRCRMVQPGVLNGPGAGISLGAAGIIQGYGSVNGLLYGPGNVNANGANQSQILQISSVGVDHDGELYMVSLDGKIWKLAPA